MRKIYFFVVAAVLFFVSCSPRPQEVLIDSFEGVLNHKTVDYGSSDNSSMEVRQESKLKVCGEQSMRLDYDLKPSGYMWIARGYRLDVKGAARWIVGPENINWENYNAFSIYMHGRNSGGIVAFDIKDRQKEMWRFILDDNFEGWKEIVCPFAKFFARTDWQPDDAEVNGVIDFPVMSFQFEPRSPGKGTYYFDCIKVVRSKN